MRLGWPLRIAGTGAALPERVVTNDDIALRIDTSDEWIRQRTGIRERRFAAPGQSTLALATEASRNALADAGVDPQEIDIIIVATITPEHPLPATGCLLQAELGCKWIPAFDIQAACSGFIWAMKLGCEQIRTGLASKVLVVGAETLTTITDMEDRNTCVLFGDASGAAVLTCTDNPQQELLASRWGADGYRGMLINIPAGGSKEPASQRTVSERMHYMRMAGREVYKFAVMQMHDIIRDTCADAGISPNDLALVIPHQSNARIIESACSKVGLPEEKVVINIDRFGNTSAASVPVALDESMRAGKIKPGDYVLMVAFGAGLTWGSMLLRV